MPEEPTDDRIHERLRAVERALTDDDRTVTDLPDDATAAAERETLDDRLSDVEARVEELEAATQAVRGYVGAIRAVNREVERRADLALARATDGSDTHGDGCRSESHGRGPAAVTTDDGSAIGAAVPDRQTTATSVEMADPCSGEQLSDEHEHCVDIDENDYVDESHPSDGDPERDVISRLREVL